ncbi:MULTISPECIES: hypothetical protein [Streptomyces]|uniref:Uncharacterized protein n=1 Tax=Streptomyces lycii TaxID=2654337 RepID=A0ABQ7FS27_9ACTN|nr:MULTISPECIES: hypothetical protein [Streptomyces]KAF4410437.1 hypothetical protein GCU69_03810 [Streptomyces lycii]PGH48920.1 hypothetical protein CRI70_20500 [Streptomyces sp. Ru87]
MATVESWDYAVVRNAVPPGGAFVKGWGPHPFRDTAVLATPYTFHGNPSVTHVIAVEESRTLLKPDGNYYYRVHMRNRGPDPLSDYFITLAVID